MTTLKKDWWKTAFGKNYFKIYKELLSTETADRQVNFIINQTKLKPKASILDLGCGYGRHAIPFAKIGYSVVGVDYSKALLSEAEKKSKKEKVHIKFLKQDFKNLQIQNIKFDLAICLFTTFGYFHTLSEHRKFLRKVRQHLKPSGLLIIDVRSATNLNNIPKNGEVSTHTHQIYNTKTHRWIMVRKLGKESIASSVRIFTLDEIKKLLTETGFKIHRVFGNYKGTLYNKKTSTRMIVLAKNKM